MTAQMFATLLALFILGLAIGANAGVMIMCLMQVTSCQQQKPCDTCQYRAAVEP